MYYLFLALYKYILINLIYDYINLSISYFYNIFTDKLGFMIIVNFIIILNLLGSEYMDQNVIHLINFILAIDIIIIIVQFHFFQIKSFSRFIANILRLSSIILSLFYISHLSVQIKHTMINVTHLIFLIISVILILILILFIIQLINYHIIVLILNFITHIQ